MFTVGLGTVANTIFTLTTMSIAIPTGVKIFNWMATLWGGSIKLNTPMLFALGFISMFIIGGLSGVMHSIAPSDAQQQDTYFIVAHIHYVLFGGSIFALFTGIYYWFPKFTGRLMHEGLGKLHFWSTMIAFNITFFPMHIVGLDGMPRRVYTYQEGMGWELGNMMATVGAFLIAFSMLIFLHNMLRSIRKGEVAGNDPWDGRTLEWSIPSPPPIYNFVEIPQVHSRDAFWEQKYPEGSATVQETGTSVQNEDGKGESYGPEGAHKRGIHLPGLSYYPLVASVGLFIGSFGFIYDFGFGHAPILSVLGLALTVIGIYGWALEPAADEVHG